MAKIIVACGSGVATSQTVASKVERLLSEKGIRASVEAVDIKSLSTFIKTADVYIAITKPKETFDIPVIDGIAFLTGMGQDKELDRIIEAIKGK